MSSSGRDLTSRLGRTDDGLANHSGVTLTVGTKKGLFLLHAPRSRDRWEFSGPFLPGVDINHAVIDSRSGRLLATANDPWFGNRVTSSTDFGATWSDSPGGPRFTEDSGRVMERLWRIEPG